MSSIEPSSSMSKPAAAAARFAPARATGLRVALLEDDEVDAHLITRTLERAWSAGVEVRCFERLAELEAHLPGLTPDVVFCDQSVPDGHGIELIERVVDAAGSVPVVVLTGSDDPSLPVLALEAGAQDYLVKNRFDGELLSRTLRHSMARSRADEALRLANDELRLVNADLEEYLGIMAHDLSARLRTGRLFAERLVAVGPGGDPGPPAEALEDTLGRMAEMIDRLIELSSLRDGRLEPADRLLSRVVDDVAADLHADLDGAGGRLEVTGDAVVRADPALFRQLLGQLVKNSIEYRSSERDLVVRIGAATEGSWTTITVRDNGIGIEPRHHDRVFGLFERLDPDRGGLGFGLAFSRRIVELHRGAITMTTPADGPGSESRIVLPIR